MNIDDNFYAADFLSCGTQVPSAANKLRQTEHYTFD